MSVAAPEIAEFVHADGQAASAGADEVMLAVRIEVKKHVSSLYVVGLNRIRLCSLAKGVAAGYVP